MKTEKRALGDLGEDAAVAYLKKQRYRILCRNYTSGHREIDIIAENRDFLVFVEVKTRTYSPEAFTRFGPASAAVDAEKRRHLSAAARAYCTAHHSNKPVRMDVVEVYFDEEDPPRLLSVHHMPDAFRAQ